MLLKRSLAATGLSLLALTSLSACGESRPSADELSTVLQEDNEDEPGVKETADCVAEILVDSDLSDETLREIVDTKGEAFEDDPESLPEEDRKIVESSEFQDSFKTCVKTAMEETLDNTDSGTPMPELETPSMPEMETPPMPEAPTPDEFSDPSGPDLESPMP